MHEVGGTGTVGYTMDKTDSTSTNNTKTGNSDTGSYTITGVPVGRSGPSASHTVSPRRTLPVPWKMSEQTTPRSPTIRHRFAGLGEDAA